MPTQDPQTRYDRIMEGVAAWCAYYRANPTRFAADYLHLDLRLFQKILICLMNLCTNTVFIGSRGIGKTFLSAIFCVIRCILYPGTKICIASGTRGQGAIVLEKIMLELKPRSIELANEIDEKQTKINGTDAKIVFKNSSYIKVVTASDTARGNRCNILLLDEFRMIAKDVVDTILKKFLTQQREPKYYELTKEERKAEWGKEQNKTISLTSAYFTDNWSYTKCLDTCKAMLSDKHRQFVCGLPYQLSIHEGLLSPNTVADEMAESDFNEIKFGMEYEALFYGDSADSFYDFNSISKNRKIKYPMLPDNLSGMLNNNSNIRIQNKAPGEIRIISADIALMASKKYKNDATAIFINQMIPSRSGRYTSNIVYCHTSEGLHTEDQALEIRRLYEEYYCDYIVLDCTGIGLGVYDALVRDMVDPDSGEVYPAISCCNNEEMADRCSVQGAEKVIWAIKGSPAMNSECALALREGFRSGKLRLLVTEYDGEQILSEIKGFNSLDPQSRLRMQLPYIHTTLLVDELVKLQHEKSGGRVRVFEKSGARKDRFSSLSYNYYVATLLENKLGRARNFGSKDEDEFMFRAPKIK